MSSSNATVLTASNSNCTDIVDGLCYTDLSTSQLATSAWLSAIGGALILITFAVVRGSKTWKPIYHKRATQISDLIYRPPPLKLHGLHRLWSFLEPVFLISDGELLATAGMDALTLIRFILLGIQLFTPLAIIGCAILLPLYRTDHGLSNSAANADYMMLYTLSNVPPRSSRLWAPWTLVLAFSAYALYVITMHFCSYAILHTLRPHVLPTTHMSDGLVTRLIGRSKERASIWSNLLCMVSPWRMYQNDLKLAAHWMKEVEETTKAMHEGKPEHHFGCPGHLEDHYEQEVREALLTAGEEAGMKDDGKWTIPESVCPWWKLPEDIPPEINPVVAGGGVLLGKSCAHRRDRIPGDKDGSKVWCPAYRYVVLYRQVGPVVASTIWGHMVETDKEVLELEASLDLEAARTRSMKEGRPMTTFAHGTRGAALDEVLRLLYPDSFQELIPVYKHKAVDLAIHKWDHIAGTLEQVETQLKLAGVDCEALDKNDTPSPSALAGDKPGSKDEESGAAAAAPAPLSGWAARKAKKEAKRIADLIEQRAKLQEELVAADANVLALRAEALSKPTDTAYFATFNNMRDALGAARGEIGAVANINMSSIPAPGADEINWEALWGNYHQVVWRTVLAVFLVIVVIAFPIGPITGAMTNLDLAVCGGSADTNDIYWPWFCQDSFNIARFIITGLLPVAISTFWDTYLLPIVFYTITQSQLAYSCYSSLDAAIIKCFFGFSVINTFAGAVVGGAIIQQAGTIVSTGQVFDLIGKSVPAASNFFMNYVIVHALFTNVFRFIWPHDGTVLFVFFRAVGLFRPKCARDEWIIRSTPSYRGGRHFGAFLLIYVIGTAYAVVAPIILPITLVYFITSWITWRYCAIHFYEPAYDGGGKVWELLYVLLLWTVWIANFFTGCVFIANQGFWSGGSLMITSTVALLIYAKCMNATLRRHSMATPTQVAAWAPRISHVPRELYMPPPLRRGAVGWFPEHSKIWEKYGIARYSLW